MRHMHERMILERKFFVKLGDEYKVHEEDEEVWFIMKQNVRISISYLLLCRHSMQLISKQLSSKVTQINFHMAPFPLFFGNIFNSP